MRRSLFIIPFALIGLIFFIRYMGSCRVSYIDCKDSKTFSRVLSYYLPEPLLPQASLSSCQFSLWEIKNVSYISNNGMTVAFDFEKSANPSEPDTFIREEARIDYFFSSEQLDEYMKKESFSVLLDASNWKQEFYKVLHSHLYNEYEAEIFAYPRKRLECIGEM